MRSLRSLPMPTAQVLPFGYLLLDAALGGTPIATYRQRLQRESIHSSANLTACPSGSQVRVAGLMVVHQAPPTAKGFHFLTLEDECGFINIIVRPPVYAHYRQLIRAHPLLMVSCEMQREGEAVNVVATSATFLQIAHIFG